MQTSNKKIFDNLVSRTKIYLVIILILLIGICWQNKVLIIPSIIIYVLILIQDADGMNSCLHKKMLLS